VWHRAGALCDLQRAFRSGRPFCLPPRLCVSAVRFYNRGVRTLRATLICTIATLVGFAVGYGLVQYFMGQQVSNDGLADVNVFIWGSVCGTFVGFIAFVVSALIFERLNRRREAQSAATKPGPS
jgi:predicted membrane protein